MGVPLDEVAEARPQAAERFDRQTEPRSLRGVTPHARDPSIDEEHRREPTLRPVHPLVMGRLDEMPVVLLAEEERLEKRKQTHEGPLQTCPSQNRQVFSQAPCNSTVCVHARNTIRVSMSTIIRTMSITSRLVISIARPLQIFHGSALSPHTAPPRTKTVL